MEESDDTPSFACAAIVERPQEIIEERDETPGFTAPAATVDKPYETIEDSELIPQ